MNSATKRVKRSQLGEMTPDMVIVGKDVLELLSSAMYVDPMAIYREYIQNAADAIDEAKGQGLIGSGEFGRVDISIDVDNRNVRIRDNGIGVGSEIAPRRLLSVGASYKRSSRLRGFRGVGRLAGLGYCRELVFRAKAAGDKQETEVIWDCRTLRANLRDPAFDGDIVDLVRGAVRLRQTNAGSTEEHYFEVEMLGIVRHKSDSLLDENEIAHYLSQVAPVPFSPEFTFGESITSALLPYTKIGGIHIHVNGRAEPLYRPHRDTFPISETATDRFVDLETFDVLGIDGEVAAFGWILHSSYLGALPVRTSMRGLRARSGDIQVGTSSIFEDCFQEERFNNWVVGELHVIDRRIVPNGRRDHFEQNAHFNNAHAQLKPLGRRLVRRCRETSIIRNRLREFEKHENFLSEFLHAPSANTLPDAHDSIFQMRRLADSRILSQVDRERLRDKVLVLATALASLKEMGDLAAHKPKASPKDELISRASALVTSLVNDDALATSIISGLTEILACLESGGER